MAKPQMLPSARIIPRLDLRNLADRARKLEKRSQKLDDRSRKGDERFQKRAERCRKFAEYLRTLQKINEGLWEIADQAYERAGKTKDRLAVDFAAPRALRAAKLYVSEKHFETRLPEYRKQLKALRKAIDGFAKLLPETDVPSPFAQMRALFCFGDPEANGNEAETPEEIERQKHLQKQWLSPTVVKASLVQWRPLIEELLRLSGKGRPPNTAELNFVSTLAQYWTEELGARLSAGRGEGRKGKEKVRNSGLFPDFVREAAKIIRRELLPRKLRPHTFETAIEEITGRKT